MLKKILTAIAIKKNKALKKNGPYPDASTNLIYHLMFCDRLQLFKDNYHGELEGPWPVLFNEKPDADSLNKIAETAETESRVRALAFNILMAKGHKVPAKELLGTIVEIRLPDGLDTLSVFVDGSARYINHTGKIAVVEGTPNYFEAEIAAVIDASKPIVTAIGPWDKDRLEAPGKGNIRMSFLVSDGLYFGEGPMGQMQKEKMASPLIDAAVSLLQKLIKETTNSEQRH